MTHSVKELILRSTTTDRPTIEVRINERFVPRPSHFSSHTPRLLRQTIPTSNNTIPSNSATSSTSATPHYSSRVPFNPKVPGSRPGRPTKQAHQASLPVSRVWWSRVVCLLIFSSYFISCLLHLLDDAQRSRQIYLLRDNFLAVKKRATPSLLSTRVIELESEERRNRSTCFQDLNG
jgi:hypothetical protein